MPLCVNSESRRIQDETAGFGSCCKLCCNLLWAGKGLFITNCCASKEESKARSRWLSLEPERWNWSLKLWNPSCLVVPALPSTYRGALPFTAASVGALEQAWGSAAAAAWKGKVLSGASRAPSRACFVPAIKASLKSSALSWGGISTRLFSAFKTLSYIQMQQRLTYSLSGAASSPEWNRTIPMEILQPFLPPEL